MIYIVLRDMKKRNARIERDRVRPLADAIEF
jgi:hypothetical protein